MEANVWPFWLFGLNSVVDNSFSGGNVGDDVYAGLREAQFLQYDTLSHIFIYIDRSCP